MQYTRYIDEILMQNKALERRNEELLKLVDAWMSSARKNKPKFIRSVDMYEIENLIIRIYKLYKIPISLFDEHGKPLFSIGWKNSCLRLHGNNLNNLSCCGEQLADIMFPDESGSFLVKVRDCIHIIGVPIQIHGELLGTILMNQFILHGEVPYFPEIEKIAYESSIDISEFSKAVNDLPVLNKDEVEKITEFYMLVAEIISFIASRNLELQDQQSVFNQKNEIASIFKEKLDDQAFIIRSVYQCLIQQHQEIELLRDELSILRKKPVLEQKEKNLVEVQPGL